MLCAWLPYIAYLLIVLRLRAPPFSIRPTDRPGRVQGQAAAGESERERPLTITMPKHFLHRLSFSTEGSGQTRLSAPSSAAWACPELA